MPGGVETLMLRRNSRIAFGGMWAFPGGQVDPEDGQAGDEMAVRARFPAVREVEEEASVCLDPAELARFSHWTPPFVTLHALSCYSSVGVALEELATETPRHYVTRVARSEEGMVVMWEGDAGYAEADAAAPGPRHRLLMTKEGFFFEDSAQL